MTLARSDHFNGKTFFNPGQASDRGMIDLLKWKMTSRPAPWPERVEVVRRPLPPASRIGRDRRNLGGAVDIPPAELLRHDPHRPRLLRAGRPCLVARAPPGRSSRRRLRRRPQGGPGAPLPRPLRPLRPAHARSAGPAGRPPGHLAPRAPLAPCGRGRLSRIVELDWWETHVCGPGRRGHPRARARTGAAGGPSRQTAALGRLHAQDRGPPGLFCRGLGVPGGLFAEMAARCGAPDLALIPIGAYDPAGSWRRAHGSRGGRSGCIATSAPAEHRDALGHLSADGRGPRRAGTGSWRPPAEARPASSPLR